MSDKKKKRQTDALKAAVLATLTDCFDQLEYIIQTVKNDVDLSEYSCARDGLAVTLRDLQERIGGVSRSVVT